MQAEQDRYRWAQAVSMASGLRLVILRWGYRNWELLVVSVGVAVVVAAAVDGGGAFGNGDCQHSGDLVPRHDDEETILEDGGTPGVISIAGLLVVARVEVPVVGAGEDEEGEGDDAERGGQANEDVWNRRTPRRVGNPAAGSGGGEQGRLAVGVQTCAGLHAAANSRWAGESMRWIENSRRGDVRLWLYYLYINRDVVRCCLAAPHEIETF